MAVSSRSALSASLVLAVVSALSGGAQAKAPAYAVSGDWKASVFGDIGGADKIVAENFEIAEREGSKVFLRSSNDRGKIASTSEGIAFYYREIPADADFELAATVAISAFAKNNQVSAGLMVRDRVYRDEFVKAELGSYAAVGPINAANPVAQFAFARGPEGLVKAADILRSPPPGPGVVYRMSLKKSGSSLLLSLGDEEPYAIAKAPPFAGDVLYLGLFTSRNAQATFSDIRLAVSRASVADLRVDGGGVKTRYRVGEDLDLTGLRVTAVYEGGRTEELSPADYAVFGFDGSRAGEGNLMISAQGIVKFLPYAVTPLACTSLSLLAYPLKTEYRLGDRFDSSGLRVLATYEEGYRAAEIGADLFALSLRGEPAAGYEFSVPGEATVTVASTETPGTAVSFPVSVSPARLAGLELGRPPERTAYFVGDALDMAGATVYAVYDDGTRDRLLRNEYSTTALDSAAPGRKVVRLQFRGAETRLELEVRAKSPLRMELLSRPKTTYAVGEGFDPTGLSVGLAYDDGSRDPLPPAAYALDSSAVDLSRPGLYTARIIPRDGSTSALSLPIAVRASVRPTWSFARFGQSTSDAGNYEEELGGGRLSLVALEGAGKVATDHDGIGFHFATLDAASDNFELSADIKVLAYAKDPHDGQEAFGIMARDVLGAAGTSVISASNMVAIGGFSGGTRNPNGTQLFARTGVTSPEGAGSLGIQRQMIDYAKPEAATTYPAKPYRLTLGKDNSGFYGRLNGGEEFRLWEPGLLSVQDGKMHVGFFAARLASIEVSGVSLTVTAAAADAAPVPAPPARLDPALDILSPATVSKDEYTLVLKCGVAGGLTVKRGLDILVRDREVAAGELVALRAKVAMGGVTPFTAALVPDDRQSLTSYSPVLRSLAVAARSYAPGGDIRVSPKGRPDGDGSAERPLDLDTAIAFVREGQSVVLEGGVYERYGSLVIPRYNDGARGARKSVVAAPGTRPVLDFSRRTEGVVLSGDFWRLEGIDIAYTAANARGLTIGGNDNEIVRCRAYGCGDTGIQISRTDALETNKARWPSRNLVLECESFDNRDPSENNADGFAAKLTSGEGNVFRGCLSHHNIDDGWDLYTKAGTGAIGAVTLERCVARDNGRTSEGVVGKGDKNGFKLGGEGVAVAHLVRGCLAYRNGAAGFTANSNPAVSLEDCFSYDNLGANFSLSVYAGAVPAFAARGLYSYKTSGGARDAYPASLPYPAGFLYDGAFARDGRGMLASREDFVAALAAGGYDPALLLAP